MEMAAHLEKALAGLKDFQNASVRALYAGLYQKGLPRMLLADEVGLGKTVVARGLIARLIKDRLEQGNRKPLKVTYICSNQVIARENFRKLYPFPQGMAAGRPVDRISLLAYAPENTDGGGPSPPLELKTLTPATSFETKIGMGNKQERLAIYATLCQDPEMLCQRRGLKWILKGKVSKDGRKVFWSEMDQALKPEFKRRLRLDLPGRYSRMLKGRIVPLDVSCIYDEFNFRKARSVHQLLIALSEKVVDNASWERLRLACRYLSRILRECLIECCLEYVGADLYILDEFQRFRDLVDEESEEEQARMARIIFGRKKSRVLLLSATPFKAFTSTEEADRGEDHYKDFSKVLRFLLGHDPEGIARYDVHRRQLHEQILDLRGGSGATPYTTHRDAVQEILRSVICRTERFGAATDPGALIEDVWKEDSHAIPFGSGDIRNFLAADGIARALERLEVDVQKPVEYCKSALFPLSFLDHYKFKESLRERKSRRGIAQALDAPNAWLDFAAMDSYSWKPVGSGDGPANARLSMLVDKAIGPHGAALLWVPPSLPYYPLEKVFGGSEGFSKTLVFSAWVMVPRMISTLVSYEVEKRTVGNSATRETTESEQRTYFTPDGKKRHPIPLIRYSRRPVKGGVTPANMSNFTLLHPSPSLAAIVDPVGNLAHGETLCVLRGRAAEKIRRRIEESKLAAHIVSDGESDRWYWAAPLLLDLAEKESADLVGHWLGRHGTDRGGRALGEEEDEAGVKEEHLRFFAECAGDPSLMGLGPMPGDLAMVLADLALGSPAVLSLRALRRKFPDEPVDELLSHAHDIADQFCSLFNKPESIAAVRLSEKHEGYWRMVAGYCASGCLQSVLDEYLHLLSGQQTDPAGVVGRLKDAINLNVAGINADDKESFASGKPRKLRCHYAVEFGSQRVETDQGRKRASSLREVFNSPFRPFVLSTTSIGQEGLDFHSYCRRIVHWNLPGNPVDLEQREGRINRYKSLVIRQLLAEKYRSTVMEHGSLATDEDVWELLFSLAESAKGQGTCDLVPFWHIDPDPEDRRIRIERVIPLYPFSADRSRLIHILKTLTIYRLAFGQPRQVELVDHLLGKGLTTDELASAMKALVVDLSPISYLG